MVIFYGLAYRILKVVEIYATRVEAEQAVRDVLEDEPDWAGMIGVESVRLEHAEPSWN